MRFLCTGLPRSRTAWFSVLMGCRHEITRETESFEDLVAKWPDNSGISDAALGFQLKRIVREIGPRVLVVERDLEDVMASFLRYMTDVPISLTVLEEHLTLLSNRLNEVQDPTFVRRLRYESLDDINAVKWAMNWLKPGVDTSRASDVMRMNVQVNRKHALEELTQTHTGWHLKEYA
jgi:hypothetical protein